jgi:hypothetical protein
MGRILPQILLSYSPMSARLRRSAALLLTVLLAGGAGRADLPRGVAPLPASSARHVAELLRAAETYRGLKALRPVPAGSMSARKLRRQLKESMPRDFPPAELRSLEISLKAFGLIPETMDLGRYLPELLSSQVAGFYEPDGKYLALVALPRSASGRAADMDEDMVLVHELTHALQDQHFDLHRFVDRDPLSDGGTAKRALVEGDATLVMIDAGLRTSFAATPGAEAGVEGMLRDPEALLAGSPDLPGAREMSAAPAWIRDSLLFSYFQGFAFCVSARRRGGQALLDHAFTTDPPRSTEQILHPEKWHTRRDDPVGLRLPDLAGELPGYRKAAEGEMGEMSLRIFLRQGLTSRSQADTAAAGWGGDRFAVYEKRDGKAGGRLIVWITEWDAETDAEELQTALRTLPGWRLERAGPTRVLAVRGGLPDETWARVREKLAAVTAERPANREIDLKALTPRPAAPSPAGGR